MFIRKKKYNEILTNINTMEKNLGVLASAIEIYPIQTTTTQYQTRQSQINETIKKYHGIAKWGNQILQRLVNLRVAFSVPNRLFLFKNSTIKSSKSEVKETKEFLNNFMALNGLDNKLPRDLAIQSELEGQAVIELVWDEIEKLPRLKFYSVKRLGYKITPIIKHLISSKLKLDLTINGTARTVLDNLFSFIAFNDELCVYEGYPTCGGILVTIENLDKDLRDWRKLNHLFAHPTPHFKCETEEEAKAINAQITTKGWKVGTALATNADFQLKGPSGSEANLLMLSIQTGAKIISGHTGLGIHFLGFPNVMSNRAVAESLGEPTEVVLHSEITSWTSFYNNLFGKAIRMRNERLNKPIRENVVGPKIVPITDRQWRMIEKVFLPILDKGFISHETFLDKLPDIDTDSELERLADEEKKNDKEKKGDKEKTEEELAAEKLAAAQALIDGETENALPE